jgi:hypothetical protein
MDYADAGDNAYTANQVVSNAYTLVFNTGMFPEACQDWRKLPAIDKTWATFKIDFAEAYRDFRLSQFSHCHRLGQETYGRPRCLQPNASSPARQQRQ